MFDTILIIDVQIYPSEYILNLMALICDKNPIWIDAKIFLYACILYRII